MILQIGVAQIDGGQYKLTLVLSNAVLLAVVLMLVMASTPIPKGDALPIPSSHVGLVFGEKCTVGQWSGNTGMDAQ